MRNRVLLLVGCVLVLGIAGYGAWRLAAWQARRPGRGMLAPFTRVDEFTRSGQYNDSLLGWRPRTRVTTVREGEWTICSAADKTVADNIVYVCDSEKMMRYGRDGTLVSTTTLEDMGLDPNSHEVWRLVGATDDRAFVTYMEHTGATRMTETMKLCSSIVEILYIDGTSVIKCHNMNEQPDCVAVWPEKRQVLSLRDVRVGVKLVDLDSGNWINTTAIPIALRDGDVDTVQWVHDVGAVFSASYYSPPMTKVIMVWPDKDRSRVLDDGKKAVLAKDGYVYYLKGDTQLWRCKPDGSPQLVYEGTKGLVEIDDLAVLVLGSGGEFIAFHCADPASPGKPAKDAIAVDLATGEYRDIVLTRWASPSLKNAN